MPDNSKAFSRISRSMLSMPDVADATDHLRLRKQSYEVWQLRAPGTVGIEDHPLGHDRVIIAGEYPLQEFAFLRFVDEHCRLITAAHGPLQRHEERSDRAAHPGVKARVLPQDCGQQCRARAR